jgi:CMP-N-acetylneuraminic acid synthetase
MAFNQRPVLALVPARGGSKGVPRKNLRLMRGRPLVAHTLEAALHSTYVDKVYLSSDDEEILEVGRSMNVESLRRTAAAASDTATAAEVVFDFIGRLSPGEIGGNPFLVYLQPTSPLRNAAHIDGAFREMGSKGATTAVSVVELTKTPYKSFVLSPEGLLQSLFEEKLSNANRQSLPAAYYPNGAIYIFPVSYFVENRGFPSNGSLPFFMSENESLDIDSEEDILKMENL